jgi:hypothetical protein
MKIQCLGSRTRHWSAVLALPGLAGVLGLVVLGAVLNDARGRQEDPAALKTRQPLGLAGYFQSDRWRGDVRTAFSLMRYLLEPEPETPANARRPALELAMPTNTVRATPKA